MIVLETRFVHKCGFRARAITALSVSVVGEILVATAVFAFILDFAKVPVFNALRIAYKKKRMRGPEELVSKGTVTELILNLACLSGVICKLGRDRDSLLVSGQA
jgi:hypothetical protein